MLNRFFTPKELAIMTIFAASLLLGAGALWYSNQKARDDSTLGVLRPEEAQREKPEIAVVPESSTHVEEAEPGGPIGIAVSGAVRREGLYWLEPDARVLDLLVAAGGADDGAYLDAINRAAKLIDGTTLTVPWEDYTATEGEQEQYKRWSAGLYLNPPEYLNKPWSDQARAQFAVAPSPVNTNSSMSATYASASSAAGGCISLSTATLADVETLPGIGPVIGQRILDYRDQHGFRDIRDLMNVSGIAEKRFAAIAHLVCL